MVGALYEQLNLSQALALQAVQSCVDLEVPVDVG